MSWWVAGTLAGVMVAGSALPAQQQPAPPNEQQEQAPPEEDEGLKPKEYTFNPLAAEKEVRVGNYYFRKGNFKAAASRFREAAKWNNNFSEAYLRLGEAEEKQKDWKAAREAYEKYLQLAGDEDKRTREIRKKIGKLPKSKT